MKPNQFYCVKCKKKVELPASDVKIVSLKNKKRGTVKAATGKCKRCGTKVFKFVKKGTSVRKSRRSKSKRSKSKGSKRSKSRRSKRSKRV